MRSPIKYLAKVKWDNDVHTVGQFLYALMIGGCMFALTMTCFEFRRATNTEWVRRVNRRRTDEEIEQNRKARKVFNNQFAY